MKKSVITTFIIGILFIGNVLFMIIGPITWANSLAHFSKLEDFKKNGIKTIGSIIAKDEPPVLSYHPTYCIGIEYLDQNLQLLTAKNVPITRIVFNNINFTKEEEIYYKPNAKDQVILAKSFDVDYLGAIDHPTYGKWATIISYSLFLLFIAFIIYLKWKNKPKPYVRPQDV